MLTLRDIMTCDVITTEPDISLREAMAMLADQHISGAPVTHCGKVLGVFSSSDLLQFVGEMNLHEPPISFRGRPSAVDDVTVADVMTRDVKSLSPDCSVNIAASFMAHEQVHRVLVMDKGKLVGIVTTTDLAGAVAKHGLLPGDFAS